MEEIVKIFKLSLYKSLTLRELIRSEKLRDPLKKIFSFTMKNQIISVELKNQTRECDLLQSNYVSIKRTVSVLKNYEIIKKYINLLVSIPSKNFEAKGVK